MRVICLVPSLTETLIECGINVVGRTRYCIHPAEQIALIPKVGGTKSVDWVKCAELNPDLVIFDREENLKQMADTCPFRWHATHITSVDGISAEFEKLAVVLESREIMKSASKWRKLSKLNSLTSINWDKVPGQMVQIANTQQNYSKLEYIIWRDPWMAVGQQTFIGSMLKKLGFGNVHVEHAKSYPELSDMQMADPDTFYLFSSEPFPFHRHREKLKQAGFNGAIVDGEVYSWFGVRSYKALKRHLITKS